MSASTPEAELVSLRPARDTWEREAGPSLPRQGRRRWLVFAVVFVLGCAAGLGYTFSLPAVYQSSATLRFGSTGLSGTPSDPLQAQSVLAQTELLLSRPLLAKVLKRLPDVPTTPECAIAPGSTCAACVIRTSPISRDRGSGSPISRPWSATFPRANG